jgi:hypothetical protein
MSRGIDTLAFKWKKKAKRIEINPFGFDEKTPGPETGARG